MIITIAIILIACGGGGGNPAPGPGSNGNPGTAGNAPGSSLTYPTRSFVVGGAFGNGGGATPTTGGAGTGGVLVIFENTGT